MHGFLVTGKIWYVSHLNYSQSKAQQKIILSIRVEAMIAEYTPYMPITV